MASSDNALSPPTPQVEVQHQELFRPLAEFLLWAADRRLEARHREQAATPEQRPVDGAFSDVDCLRSRKGRK